MKYAVKRKSDEHTTVIFNGCEYLDLYRWEQKWYETHDMSADTFLIVEKWLNKNGYQDIRFYDKRSNV